MQGLWDTLFAPNIPDNMHIDPYTGHVTWETGISPHHIDPAPYPDAALLRPTGLEADASQRSTYTMLQPASTTSPQPESGEEVSDGAGEKRALIDVVYNAGGGYDLPAAICYANQQSTSDGSSCRATEAQRDYDSLSESERAAVYQGSRAYEDLFCDTQTGFAGVSGSTRHYRAMQGCIRRRADKQPAKPGVYPLVVIAYSKSYDPFSVTSSGLQASNVDPDNPAAFGETLSPVDISKVFDQAYVKTTMELRVVLQPAMRYCAQGCNNLQAMQAELEGSSGVITMSAAGSDMISPFG